MASKLATYGFINAKLRTRISKILKREELVSLLQAETNAEVVSLLQATEYRDAAAAFADTGDIRQVEATLLETEIHFFLDIGSKVPGAPGEFISALLIRYEVETLKRALRLWFERSVKQREIEGEAEYLYYGFPRLQVEKVIQAQTLEEIAGLLTHTSYGSIVAREVERDPRQFGLFPLETALDRFYFSSLLGSIGKLTTADKKIAQKLISVEIDLENIERIVKFKELYGFSQERLIDYIIPSGAAIGTRDLTGDGGEIIRSFVTGRYPGLAPLIETTGSDKYSNLVLLEAVLNEVLSLEVKRILMSYPFTLGIVLAYFFLKRREVRRIVMILNAKAYALDDDRVRTLL